MKLQDALFNWLQIRVVSEAREDDNAARETMDFFETILREDHNLSHFAIVQTDDSMYVLDYVHEGVSKKQMFDRISVEALLHDINSNPKYNS
ncbi:hypothetical protein NV379_04690 [Paenibacillus sp. N1-5-1-14]|uniref:hypothetical protein n=1 Tax=Paenibacillus radicibacter TaxID=2972488 RepID=UPI002158DE20|nr:hypothetical protein [Paenibacillus radicibacter]MCR8641948.1 hypothetical protein [Paenibacillus radicibacter]